ncbi:hypothetical cytosolic protein [Syntrophus aciditrophicus SB]|uniref:Hypothetical cytosolic protein n=1 Tax=Syntrophus aciditrophicus (strain SB) TaxID=56780 RepID=Q2LRC9_SYNAS|nr:hypothetical cytosolic protein [Syntrophus aciditrophicus SB]
MISVNYYRLKKMFYMAVSRNALNMLRFCRILRGHFEGFRCSGPLDPPAEIRVSQTGMAPKTFFS